MGLCTNVCVRCIGHLYRGRINEYYQLCVREARAYSFYACSTTLLPNLVVALILFYGGQVSGHCLLCL